MNQILRWGAGLCAVVAAGLLAGCTESGPGDAPVTIRYAYGDGAGTGARVLRTIGADGSESLHGETALTYGGDRLRIVEDAIVDRAGHLVRAEITVARGCDAPPDEDAIFEPARGTVRVSGPGGTVEWPVPTDAPWAYGPVSRAGGQGVLTPVGAFLVMRAAAGAAAVRVIQTDASSSYLAPADQVAVVTESGVTVVLDTTSADADRSFIRSVDLPALGIAMARVEGPPDKPTRVCALDAPAMRTSG
jgi:hypothetical protein